jgi:CDP-diacylglycerol---serine O-phosphatidyltransferase
VPARYERQGGIVIAGHTRLKYRPVRLLPSIVTIMALSAGMSAVKFALDRHLDISLAMIGAAAVLDTLDGRLARLLAATTKIGGELDSLADAISFGVAPSLVLYASLLHNESIGWMVSLLFTICIVLRLARFNTLMDDDTRPPWAREYFVGVPAPAGALIAMTPVATYLQFGKGWWDSPAAVTAWTVLASALVVSTIPTLTLKFVSVPPQAAAALLVLAGLMAAALITYPLILLTVLVMAYLAHIPFAIRSQRWVAARPETWDHKPAERRAQRRAGHRLPVAAARRLRRSPMPKMDSTRLRLRRPPGSDT